MQMHSSVSNTTESNPQLSCCKSAAHDLLILPKLKAGVTYRRPFRHLPLGAAGGALAGPSLHGSLQVGHGAKVTVYRAVQARREHLPAADLSKLETFAAGPRALAPAAGLPPGRRARCRATCCWWWTRHFSLTSSTWAGTLSQCRSHALALGGSERRNTCRAPPRRRSEHT